MHHGDNGGSCGTVAAPSNCNVELGGIVSKVYGLRLFPSEVDRLPELLRDNSVAIGWSHAVDLKNPALDKSGFRTELETTYPGLKGHALSTATNDTWRFLREMEIGDILVIPHGDDIHFAKVTGKARHVPRDLSKDTVFQRDVARLLDGKPQRRHDLPFDLQTALKFRNTTADLSRVEAEVKNVIGSEYHRFQGLVATFRHPE